MIPVLSIFDFLSALFCFFAARRIYHSYKKTKNNKIGQFFWAFAILVVYFFVVSLPGFNFLKPEHVQIIYSFSYFLAFLPIIIFLKIVLEMNGVAWSKIGLSIIIISVFIISILSFLFSSPARLEVYKSSFYHWEEGTPPSFRFLKGVIIGFLGFVCCSFFIRQGLKYKDKIIRVKTLYLGWGLGVLIIAALSSFSIASQFSGSIIWWISLTVGRVLAVIGLGFMVRGIYAE